MAIHGFGEIAEQLRRSTVLVSPGGRGNGSGLLATTPWAAGPPPPPFPGPASIIFPAAAPPAAGLGGSGGRGRPPPPGRPPKAFVPFFLEGDPAAPAANASLLPGDILLGT